MASSSGSASDIGEGNRGGGETSTSSAARGNEQSLQCWDNEFVPRTKTVVFNVGDELGELFEALESKSVSFASSKSSRLD